MTEQPQVEKDIRKVTQEELSAKAESIYEAIMVISKRTKQIRRENREDFEKTKRELYGGEPEPDRNNFNDNEIELPKYERAERVAIDEFLKDKLKYEYIDITKTKH